MTYPIKPTITVTGANGFLASALIDKLSRLGYRGYALSRKPITLNQGFRYCPISNINAETNYQTGLKDVDCVIHCAAQVHIPSRPPALDKLRQVNVAGSLNLANQAYQQGVKRFIFISSIKALGEETPGNIAYTHHSTPAPVDCYGISKLEAERALQAFTDQVGMELVIIRPPLMYGAGVQGNFLQLLKCVDKGIPLPLGAIHNQRSFLALDNMVDLIICCISHKNAANQLFLASDDQNLSTTELLEGIAKALGRRSRLIPLPMSWIDRGSGLIGQRAIAQRLCGSLVLDISHTRQRLGWTPPVSVAEGLAKTIADYRKKTS